jgi:4-oxalocrotonate tautomerase
MLLVTVDVLKNVLTPDQKELLIKKLTAALIDVEGENIRPVASVRINEFEGGDWAIGGRRMSAHDVLEIARGKQPSPLESGTGE